MNATKYHLWIAYRDERMINDEDNANDSTVLSYYCTCKAGARTLGTCAHVASVLWFLGYARHQANVKYPSTRLLHNVLDARNR